MFTDGAGSAGFVIERPVHLGPIKIHMAEHVAHAVRQWVPGIVDGSDLPYGEARGVSPLVVNSRPCPVSRLIFNNVLWSLRWVVRVGTYFNPFPR